MEKYTKNEILSYLKTQENLADAINNIDSMGLSLIDGEPEMWENVSGYDGVYQISNYGRLKSFMKYPDGAIMTLLMDKHGYPRVNLGSLLKTSKYKRIQPGIHQLVARAYVPNPYGLPAINHKDGNKLNNFYKNLEWCTFGHNNKHAFEIGLRKGMNGENNPSSNLTNEKVIQIYNMAWSGEYTQKQIADMFDVRIPTVSHIKHKRTWKELLKDL